VARALACSGDFSRRLEGCQRRRQFPIRAQRSTLYRFLWRTPPGVPRRHSCRRPSSDSLHRPRRISKKLRLGGLDRLALPHPMTIFFTDIRKAALLAFIGMVVALPLPLWKSARTITTPHRGIRRLVIGRFRSLPSDACSPRFYRCAISPYTATLQAVRDIPISFTPTGAAKGRFIDFIFPYLQALR
jgi:hypothetical protein